VSARVLIVEDEAAIRLALSGLLRRQGYAVAQAESGEKAIAALQGEPWRLPHSRASPSTSSSPTSPSGRGRRAWTCCARPATSTQACRW
jgi:CheY-like chemotaxis protein